jgi:hypothetical protein
VLNPPANGLDGRQKGVSSITMSDALVLFTIFLVVKLRLTRTAAWRASGVMVEPLMALAWAKQVEVANKEEVSDGRLRGVGGGQRVDGMAQKGQGDGFDSLWGRVGRFPGALHLLDGLDNVASGI